MAREISKRLERLGQALKPATQPPALDDEAHARGLATLGEALAEILALGELPTRGDVSEAIRGVVYGNQKTN